MINHRSALLSNFEVLTLLRELESDHLAKTRNALRIKKEEEAAGTSAARNHVPQEEVLENLRTVEVEVRLDLSPFDILSTARSSGNAVSICELSTYRRAERGRHSTTHAKPRLV